MDVTQDAKPLALEGLKVLDLTWVIAGPLATKCLADHGATVIRVESRTKPDILRTSAPYKDRKPGLDRAGFYTFFNSNKLSLSLNVDHPKGRDVLKRLVGWADVVVENFTPGVMERWGLGYEELTKIKPDIILLRSSLQGQTGPHAVQPGLGSQLVSFAGFTHLTGWPDRDPVQPQGAYTDLVVPLLAVAAILAAVLQRRRTGKGQCIDLSQYEASLQFLAPVLLDYLVNGREGTRQGNSSPDAAPHGAYACLGEDRWCAIAVASDEQWRAFCGVLGEPDWTKDARFATLPARKANEDALNALVTEWTSGRTAEEVMAAMQRAGVPAGIVESVADLLEDPQLRHREAFWMLAPREIGPFPHLGQPFKLSETPAQARRPSPDIGMDNEHVCRAVLGMSEEEFKELGESEALS